MCVSTATVGWPNAVFSTTLAVLRPTPGRRSSASRSPGTSPPCSLMSISDSATTFFALVRYRPMVRIKGSNFVTPMPAISPGVIGKNLRVARLTDLSVACAESTTATSSSNGVAYSSSVVGFGFAACSRR
jgi:hypothetical protein